MANPQKENGYTAIANEILEALYSSSLNATQLRILLVVFRFTYGFSRKDHSLSVGFLSKATGISKRYISSELKKLVDYKILEIKKEHTDTESREISFNKHYDRWSIVRQVKDCSSGEQLITTTDEVLFTTPDEELFIQESNIKTNIKTNMYDLLFESFWKEYPRKLGKGEAYKTWKTRLNEKHSPDELILAAKNYASICKKKGTEVDYIKHPKTFLSKTMPWKDYLIEPKQDKLKTGTDLTNYVPKNPEVNSDDYFTQ